MEISSLNYLKKTMHKGTCYKIVAHYQPELIGMRCVVTMKTWHGFHAVACDETGIAIRGREHETITIWWHWSACWVFADGQCTLYNSEKHHTDEHFIASIRVME